MNINEKEFLCKVYKMGNNPVDFIKIGKELGFNEDVTKNIVLSLHKKKLIKLTVSGGNWNDGGIDNYGLKRAKELCGEE
jgi:RNA-binding protein YhbY